MKVKCSKCREKTQRIKDLIAFILNNEKTEKVKKLYKIAELLNNVNYARIELNIVTQKLKEYGGAKQYHNYKVKEPSTI